MSSLRKSSFSAERARAAFSKQTAGQSDRTPYYPFHKLPEGKSSTLRFIPDANPDNELGFLIERRTHELVVDGDKVRIPCLEMYGEDCPICKLSRQYYKAKDTVNGKKYWPKKDHLTRAIVVKDGLPPDPETGETYQGKVVTVSLGKTLYDIIAHNISSGDLGDLLPCDVSTGTDFIITRTVKPGPNGEKYSDYALSKFARTARGLEEEEIAIIEFEDSDGATPNYVDLSTLLAKKPTLEYVTTQLELSLGGAGGDDDDAPPPPRQAARPVSRPAEEEAPAKPAPAKAKPAASDDDDDAEAFLQQIRNRRAQSSRNADADE